MKRNKIVRYVILPVLVLLAAAALYIYKEYNRTLTDPARLKPDYSVTASELIKEFITNEQSANKKYWDKVIQVNGMVKDIEKDDWGFYSISMGDTSAMSSVRCRMDSVHRNEVAFLNKGDIASMKGICTGFITDELLGSDVILVRCVVNSKK